MIVQARGYRYEVKQSRKITHETLTKRYALANLEETLIRARRDLEQMPTSQRRRQREKISRLESRIDVLRLELDNA